MSTDGQHTQEVQSQLSMASEELQRRMPISDGGGSGQHDGHVPDSTVTSNPNSTCNAKTPTHNGDTADDTIPGAVPPSNASVSSTHSDTESPSLPRLSRAFSMPLPSQTSHWQHPGRSPLSVDATSSITEEKSHEQEFHDLALELADSVQLAVQTLFQLSPPHIFDPAKEQFSGCAVQIPTPSLTALLTSMKNLNYISANVRNLGDAKNGTPYIDARADSWGKDEFDIGELLQSVGDSFGGVASEAEVDLVLHHGDAFKHMGVRGDECGISYALSHILHQELATARQGDSIEIGLSITRQKSPSDDPSTSESESAPVDSMGPVVCIFEIAHKFTTFIPSLTLDNLPPSSDDGLSEIQGTDPESVPTFRPEPYLGSVIFRRLLPQIGGTLRPPIDLPRGRRIELAVKLERGPSLAALHQRTPAVDDELFPDLPVDIPLAREPSLDELMIFADSLKGRKVSFYANSHASFTIHLTKYLTTWGMDITHLSTDGNEDKDGLEDQDVPEVPVNDIQSTLVENGGDATSDKPTAADTAPSFVIIDDDVLTLKRRLLQYRAEMMPTLQTRKRPSLAVHHRPRSSPSIRNSLLAAGVQKQAQLSPFAPVPIVHFTSLGKYKLVKDVIQASLFKPGLPPFIPEVIVIPKPAGPRRILVALHTAIRKPMIDPFFSPIATSPMSPGAHISPLVSSPRGIKDAPSPPTMLRTVPEKPPRTNSDATTLSASSPLPIPEGLEYFSPENPMQKLGSTAASGLVIPGADGKPAILFQPQSRTNSHRSTSSETGPSPSSTGATAGASAPTASRGSSYVGKNSKSPGREQPVSPERPRMMEEVGHGLSFRRPATSPRTQDPLIPRTAWREAMQILAKPAEGAPVPSLTSTPSAAGSRSVVQSPTAENPNSPPSLIRKPTSPGSSTSRSPLSPTGSEPRRPGGRRNTLGPKSPLGPGGKKGATKTVGNNIVPPINVLLVEDNPINQTMVSTFMKRNKIKYEVAWNGKEAVEKWKRGNFHIILMDIQMPVMNGIEATKEIRRLEKLENIRHFPPSPGELSRRSMGSTPDSQGSNASTPFRSQVIIVALTASSRQSDRVAALAAGCNDFLTKPVMTSWLADKIIEWGSIKALQMWAELRPDIEDTITHEQQAQAQAVAERLHVPPQSARRSPTRGQATLEGGSSGGEKGEGEREPRSLTRPKHGRARTGSKDSSSSGSSLERYPVSSDDDSPPAIPNHTEPPTIFPVPDPSNEQPTGPEVNVEEPTPDISERPPEPAPEEASEKNVGAIPPSAEQQSTSLHQAEEVGRQPSPEEVTGAEALRQYIEETKERDTYTDRPTLLGSIAIESRRSSKSIASVLHETPAKGGNPRMRERETVETGEPEGEEVKAHEGAVPEEDGPLKSAPEEPIPENAVSSAAAVDGEGEH